MLDIERLDLVLQRAHLELLGEDLPLPGDPEEPHGGLSLQLLLLGVHLCAEPLLLEHQRLALGLEGLHAPAALAGELGQLELLLAPQILALAGELLLGHPALRRHLREMRLLLRAQV